MNMEVFNRTCILRTNAMRCLSYNTVIQCVFECLHDSALPFHLNVYSMYHVVYSFFPPGLLSSFVFTSLANLGLETALDGVDRSS